MSRAITSSLTFIACFVSLSRATSIVWRSGNTVSGLGTGQTPYKITFVLAPTTALALDDTVTVIARNEADSADVQIFAATTRACTLTQGATTTSAKKSEGFGAQLVVTANGAFTTADLTIVCTMGLAENGAQASTVRFSGMTSKDTAATTCTGAQGYTVGAATPPKYVLSKMESYTSNSGCSTMLDEVGTMFSNIVRLGECQINGGMARMLIESCWDGTTPMCQVYKHFDDPHCQSGSTYVDLNPYLFKTCLWGSSMVMPLEVDTSITTIGYTLYTDNNCFDDVFSGTWALTGGSSACITPTVSGILTGSPLNSFRIIATTSGPVKVQYSAAGCTGDGNEYSQKEYISRVSNGWGNCRLRKACKEFHYTRGLCSSFHLDDTYHEKFCPLMSCTSASPTISPSMSPTGSPSRATSIVWRSGNTVSGLGTGQTPYKITFVLAPTTALALDDTVTVIARNEADSADVHIFAAATRACTLTQGATTTSAKTSEVKKWSTPHFGAQLIITANGAFTTADLTIVCTMGLAENGAQASTVRFSGMTSKDTAATTCTGAQGYTVGAATPPKYVLSKMESYTYNSGCSTMIDEVGTISSKVVRLGECRINGGGMPQMLIESCWDGTTPMCQVYKYFDDPHCQSGSTYVDLYPSLFKTCLWGSMIVPLEVDTSITTIGYTLYTDNNCFDDVFSGTWALTGGSSACITPTVSGILTGSPLNSFRIIATTSGPVKVQYSAAGCTGDGNEWTPKEYISRVSNGWGNCRLRKACKEFHNTRGLCMSFTHELPFSDTYHEKFCPLMSCTSASPTISPSMSPTGSPSSSPTVSCPLGVETDVNGNCVCAADKKCVETDTTTIECDNSVATIAWWNPSSCNDCKCMPTCTALSATDSSDGFGNCVCASDKICTGSGCNKQVAGAHWWAHKTCTDCMCAPEPCAANGANAPDSFGNCLCPGGQSCESPSGQCQWSDWWTPTSGSGNGCSDCFCKFAPQPYVPPAGGAGTETTVELVATITGLTKSAMQDPLNTDRIAFIALIQKHVSDDPKCACTMQQVKVTITKVEDAPSSFFIFSRRRRLQSNGIEIHFKVTTPNEMKPDDIFKRVDDYFKDTSSNGFAEQMPKDSSGQTKVSSQGVDRVNEEKNDADAVVEALLFIILVLVCCIVCVVIPLTAIGIVAGIACCCGAAVCKCLRKKNKGGHSASVAPQQPIQVTRSNIITATVVDIRDVPQMVTAVEVAPCTGKV